MEGGDQGTRGDTAQAPGELDAILAAIALPIYVASSDGVITYANQAAVDALGFDDASELIGQNGHWLVHYKRPDGSHFPIEECPLSRSREGGEPITVEDDWWVRKDGAMIPVAYRAMPVRTTSGFATAIAFSDASERMALREREVDHVRAIELAAGEARHRATLEAALDCVISIDAEGRVTFFNSAAERTFGYLASEVLGRSLADTIVPPELRSAHQDGLARYLATEEARVLDRRLEMTAMRADGSTFHAELTVTRVNLPGEISFTGYIRDITERRQAHEDLIAARRRVIEAADAARRRVTRDLHDGAQQRFVNALINLQLARQKWASDPDRAAALLDVADREAARGLLALRELAAGIHPAILTDGGLAEALTSLTTGLPFPVELHVQSVRLLPAIEASVYFFCSEALTNIAKHARARNVRVHIGVSGGKLSVEVSDDGIGGAAPGLGSTGLLGLGDRIGALDGTLEIISERSQGTTLRAEIPLQDGSVIPS
ncbi:MAG TPA: PAS domain S-box protein [Solirubrobacteraceae bacterium]